MVDINVSAVTWPSPTQYAQSVIDGEAAGTSFVLKAGVHRMQTISLRTGDTLTFEPGAIMRGSEDISGWTWTKDGANDRWWATLSSPGTELGGTANAGYLLYPYAPVLDGEPMAYKDALTSVDAWTAFYDTGQSRLYIGRDPAGLTSMELMRQVNAIGATASNVTGVTIQGDRGTPGIIENYCPGPQAENAGVKIGRFSTSTITNANWVFQDMIVRNMRGMAVGQGETTTLRRVTIYNNGQCGVSGTGADGSTVEYIAVFRNGIGGWDAGWEAGNTKWAYVIGQTQRGNWYDTLAPWDSSDADLHPHLDASAPLWWDIDNDGIEIYGSHVLDRGHAASRGLFYEISFSLKAYHNNMYELGWNVENNFWSNGIIFATSGAIPGTTVFSTSEVYDNILHMCSGGVKHVSNNRGTSSIYGNPNFMAKNCNTYRNAILMKSDLVGITGVHGSDGSPSYSPWGENLSSEANVFYLDSLESTHFRVASSAEGNTGYNWTGWTGTGRDAPDGEAYVYSSTNPLHDINPYKGGCL